MRLSIGLVALPYRLRGGEARREGGGRGMGKGLGVGRTKGSAGGWIQLRSMAGLDGDWLAGLCVCVVCVCVQ